MNCDDIPVLNFLACELAGYDGHSSRGLSRNVEACLLFIGNGKVQGGKGNALAKIAYEIIWPDEDSALAALPR